MSEQVSQFILSWDQFCQVKVVKNNLGKEIWDYKMCPLLLSPRGGRHDSLEKKLFPVY